MMQLSYDLVENKKAGLENLKKKQKRDETATTQKTSHFSR